MLLPQKLNPAFKDYIWGGTKLKEQFSKSCSFEKIAESWELSCHEDGPSVIAGSNQTLAEYIKENGKEVLGTNCSHFDSFPVLIKLIDASDNLSVQVHPDNSYALEHEGEYGKTEMWYIVDCEEGSSLLYGFSKNITKEEFSESIKNNTLLSKVKKVPVKKGDVFFIKSGTLHAIGKGIVIAEIQQNSNTTYRIYDYGRKDKNGNERELHIDKACEVTDLCPAEPCPFNEPCIFEGYSSRLLSSCEYFTVHLVDITEKAGFDTDSTSFEHLLVIEGKGTLESQNFHTDLKKGDSLFIPAGYGRFTVKGNCLIIKTRID
ncbi:MAG: type I phosphomannose isomerase catalytic subunit [Oscillospiraceae bacterium]|nr:class I mannose-6-phosphate isomerase [Oscillospiraceae bacterium]